MKRGVVPADMGRLSEFAFRFSLWRAHPFSAYLSFIRAEFDYEYFVNGEFRAPVPNWGNQWLS